MRRIVPIAVLAALLWASAGANAQKCVARPGTAALDQYCETVPTDAGDAPAHRDDGHLRSSLTSTDVSRLEKHGDDGAAVLALPSGPKPPSRPSGGSPTGPALGATPPQGAPVETDAPPDAPSSNPFSVAFDALGGVGALGWGVVLLLALLAALAAAALVRLPRGPSKSV